VTSLRLANGPLAAPVLCRVVSMMLSRADCPLNRLDDAMLVCDAIAAHAPAHTAEDYLAVCVDADKGEGDTGGQMQLRVSALGPQGAQGLLRDAAVPGVGNVLEKVADELRVQPSLQGGNDELVLAITF
jgi:serine/threonine-protein kinase RsbW